ncbi:hypothetical protein [Rufibacter ruber]|uniref:hypothetical protein n=1 Tax=Rufibacter ruber TaxID=1783499 RepID=UPI00082D8021|nr:hypothetical protein [Rufibacter ruber]
MSTQEFFEITTAKREDLKRMCLKHLRDNFDAIVQDSYSEEILTDIILSTAEKLARVENRPTINNWNDVRNYIIKSFWYQYKNKGIKQRRDLKAGKFTSIDGIEETILAPEPTTDPIITDVADVRTRIEEYVYGRYEPEEAAIYKAHSFKGYTFDKLAEVTRVNRNRCYRIVKKIQADVQANKEYILSGEKKCALSPTYIKTIKDLRAVTERCEKKGRRVTTVTVTPDADYATILTAVCLKVGSKEVAEAELERTALLLLDKKDWLTGWYGIKLGDTILLVNFEEEDE